jgi:hypothetical protein
VIHAQPRARKNKAEEFIWYGPPVNHETHRFTQRRYRWRLPARLDPPRSCATVAASIAAFQSEPTARLRPNRPTAGTTAPTTTARRSAATYSSGHTDRAAQGIQAPAWCAATPPPLAKQRHPSAHGRTGRQRSPNRPTRRSRTRRVATVAALGPTRRPGLGLPVLVGPPRAVEAPDCPAIGQGSPFSFRRRATAPNAVNNQGLGE